MSSEGIPVAWQYRYRQEGPNAFIYNTFVHPIEGMGRTEEEIEWWVFGVKVERREPVAWLYKHWENYELRVDIMTFQVDHLFHDSNGNYVKGIPLYE